MADTGGCKVDRVCEKYGLDASGTLYESLDEHLLVRWTGADGRSPHGYKRLTAWFNRRLLKSVYDRHGRETIATRLESEFEVLTGDDDLVRKELVDELVDDGIDVERVCADMVSWSTMRHHLKGCLDGEKEPAKAETEWERESIDVAKHVTATKTKDALRSLESKDELHGSDAASVEVDVYLSCPFCPTRVRVEDALARGYICGEHLGTGPDSA